MSREISDYRFNLSDIVQPSDRFSVQVAISQLKHAQQMVKGIIGTKDDNSKAIDPSKWTAGEIGSVLRLIEEQRKFAGDVWHPGVIGSSHPSRPLKRSVRSRLEKNREDTSKTFGELDGTYSKTIRLLNELRERADVAQSQTPTTIPDFGVESEVKKSQPNNILRPNFGEDDSRASVKFAAQIALLPVLMFGGFDNARSVDMSQHQDANHTTQTANENVTISALNKVLARVLYGETINSGNTSISVNGSIEDHYVSTNPNFRSVPGENSQGGGELAAQVTLLAPRELPPMIVISVENTNITVRSSTSLDSDTLGTVKQGDPIQLLNIKVEDGVWWYEIGMTTVSNENVTGHILADLLPYEKLDPRIQNELVSHMLHQVLSNSDEYFPNSDDNSGGSFLSNRPDMPGFVTQSINQFFDSKLQQISSRFGIDFSEGSYTTSLVVHEGSYAFNISRNSVNGIEHYVAVDQDGLVVSPFEIDNYVGLKRIELPGEFSLIVDSENGGYGLKYNNRMIGNLSVHTNTNVMESAFIPVDEMGLSGEQFNEILNHPDPVIRRLMMHSQIAPAEFVNDNIADRMSRAGDVYNSYFGTFVRLRDGQLYVRSERTPQEYLLFQQTMPLELFDGLQLNISSLLYPRTDHGYVGFRDDEGVRGRLASGLLEMYKSAYEREYPDLFNRTDLTPEEITRQLLLENRSLTLYVPTNSKDVIDRFNRGQDVSPSSVSYIETKVYPLNGFQFVFVEEHRLNEQFNALVPIVKQGGQAHELQAFTVTPSGQPQIYLIIGNRYNNEHIDYGVTVSANLSLMDTLSKFPLMVGADGPDVRRVIDDVYRRDGLTKSMQDMARALGVETDFNNRSVYVLNPDGTPNIEEIERQGLRLIDMVPKP